MLEGLNDGWIYLGNRRFVSFSDIKEGNYVLKIKGSNNDGVWNEKGISLIIIKKPPWWRTVYAYIALGILLMLIFLLTIWIRTRALISERKYLEKQVEIRTNEIQIQKAEIEAQRDEIEVQRDYTASQRDKLKQMNDSLTDSIYYAKRIQSAILPNKEILINLFKESFILYLPKDIISGDFYWVKEIINANKRKVYFAVADCTGHGVPGGFVSMLGITLLNEIITDKKSLFPAEVLNILRDQVKHSLQQTWENRNSKDGMDISLCMFDEETKKLTYAGANSRLHISKKDELQEIVGDRMPIGIYYNERPFTNHTINIENNDVVYLYSDGYQDQFGGNKGMKFMRKSFNKLLVQIKDLNLDTQKENILKTLKDWQSNNFEQVDDITIMGIKF